MQYLISDIHGHLDDFKKMLSKINYDKSKDSLVIMGDVVDRGPDGIAILNYIRAQMEENSWTLLMGNHEMFAVMYMEGQLDRRLWTSFGGGDTVEDIDRMTEAERAEMHDFLVGLPYYVELKSKFYGDVVVTHTGIDCDNYVFNEDGTINVTKSIDRAIKYNKYYFMVGTDLHDISVADRRKLDRFIIVGHVPCSRLNDDESNKFYRTNYYIDLDAGNGHKESGGMLGCYCVDSDEERYL